MSDLRKAAEMALDVLETLWDILDDIDTASDMAKENDAWYRKRVEALQKKRWDTMITTDGYKLKGGPVEALRQALAHPDLAKVGEVGVWGNETAKGEHEPLGGEWVPCVKLPVIVHVRNQRDGENHISTREGITPVLPEDLIMRGVAGEEYPIGRELFERTYTFDVDAVNMTAECVDETVKSKREWVGLDGEIPGLGLVTEEFYNGMLFAEDILRERNGG